MSPSHSHARVLPHIVEQHCEEAAHLLAQRWALLNASTAGLKALDRVDERLAAHLDGLRVAGEFGRRLADRAANARRAFDTDLFAAAVLALEAGDLSGFLSLAGAVPAHRSTLRVLLAALGWVPAATLQGIGIALIDGPFAWNKALGLYSCVLHRVDAGRRLDTALGSPDPVLRACALRCAGESGRQDLLAACREALASSDAQCLFWGARSAVLLGDRARSLDALADLATRPGRIPRRSLDVLLKVLDMRAAHALLGNLARQRTRIRLAIRGAGICGDPAYIPWLIKQSTAPALARLSGEAFSNVTGAELEEAALHRPPPPDFTSGPTDSPDDDDVALDEDDGLPWPDPAKLQAWWEVNHQRFQPGVRYFLGAPPTVEHCRKVLREGYQRQRVAAAEYLCLLAPGTPLFPTSAPAWRQQRWLRQMG